MEDGYGVMNLSNTGYVASGIEFLKAWHAMESTSYISPDKASDNSEFGEANQYLKLGEAKPNGRKDKFYKGLIGEGYT